MLARTPVFSEAISRLAHEHILGRRLATATARR
jgi:hypothetical protein